MEKIENRIAVLGAERGLNGIAGIARVCNLPYQTVGRQWRNEADSIDYETLAKICAGLNCKPGDVLVLKQNGHNGP